MGLYDVPAEIDFILSNTGKQSLTYIGHSEGTTQFFIGSSMLPDYYKSKVNLFIALAPIARLTHEQNTVLRIASEIIDPLEEAVKVTGFYDIFKMNQVESFLSSSFCKLVGRFCTMMADNNWDYNTLVDNDERYPDKMAHQPAGAGWRTLIHYGQIIKDGKF